MFLHNVLLFHISTATFASASPALKTRDSPVSTLAFARTFNFLPTTGGKTMADADRSRFEAFHNNAQSQDDSTLAQIDASIGSTLATNQLVSYTTNVQVGDTTFALIVDTGSSNTWVGAYKPTYVKSSTSVATNRTVTVNYGSGRFSGFEFLDRVTLGSQLVVNNQSIANATSYAGFSSNTNGILGLGPNDLTYNTFSPRRTVPTVTDNLYSQGKISANQVAVSFSAPSQPGQVNGQLTFGGTDSSKFTGSINYTPITSTSPSNQYWGINQSIKYGNTTILPATAGIVDTGTTLILLPTNAFNAYKSATGAVLDGNTGLLRITSAQYANLSSLFFSIGTTSYELIPNGQIWPRALNRYIGGSNSYIYLIVGNTGQASGAGLDFLNGQAFLERFYSVYDTGNKRVGFATSSSTRSTSN